MMCYLPSSASFVLQEGNSDQSFILASSTQRQLRRLQNLPNLKGRLLHVEGPHRFWLKKIPQYYYTLELSGQPPAEWLEVLHEGNEGT